MSIEKPLKDYKILLIKLFSIYFSHAFRTEPTCITCDLGEVLWNSRVYYGNCSHFDAYVSPQSSISSDSGVEYYILECRGLSLPYAGELLLKFPFSLSHAVALESLDFSQWKIA